MKKRVFYSFLLIALGANLFLGAQVYLGSVHAAEEDQLYDQIEVFTRALERVREEYVDGEKVTYETLIRNALKGMVGSLDPHSEFMEPAKFKELQDETEGSFGGLGIVIEMRDDVLTVVAPMEGAPAFHAGILSGDKIIQVEEESTEDLSLIDAVKLLKGKPGTDVTITVKRPGVAEPKEFTLTRKNIKVDTVKDITGGQEFPVDDNGIGYVRLRQFGEQTASDLKKALQKLDDNGMRGLVLDLRNNPGGLLVQAIKVSEFFVPRGQLVVSTKGRRSFAEDEHFSRTADQYPDVKIVVLVNSGSASASEIVAGCLQDIGRGFVMGEQTFGKGSVQTIVPLDDGAALRLTTARYYTPEHRMIHGKGIAPDSVVPMSAEQQQGVFLRRLPGEIDALPPEQRKLAEKAEDVQLERAVDFLKGIMLYETRRKSKQRVASF